jgi:hypothetical protein
MSATETKEEQKFIELLPKEELDKLKEASLLLKSIEKSVERLKELRINFKE